MEPNSTAAASVFFDASGAQVADQAAHAAARVPAGLRPATACLELHAAGVVFKIQVIVNPNAYPFLIVGGAITGDICNGLTTHWVVSGGSFGSNLVIEAKRVPLANAPAAIGSVAGSGDCATSMSIVGSYRAPDSYAGTYGTNGSSAEFSHTTLFKGWNACP